VHNLAVLHLPFWCIDLIGTLNLIHFPYQKLGALLYEEAEKSQITDLEGIEKTVRSRILELVSPEIALFLWNKQPEGK
jgi:hypothetical protein